METVLFVSLIVSLIYVGAVLARLYFSKETLISEYPYEVQKAYMEMHPELTKEKVEKLKYHKIAGIVVATIGLGLLSYIAGARNDSFFGVIKTIFTIYIMWLVLLGFHTGVVNYLIFEKMEIARLPYTEEMDKAYESNHLKLKLDLKKWLIVGIPISVIGSIIVFFCR